MLNSPFDHLCITILYTVLFGLAVAAVELLGRGNTAKTSLGGADVYGLRTGARHPPPAPSGHQAVLAGDEQASATERHAIRR